MDSTRIQKQSQMMTFKSSLERKRLTLSLLDQEVLEIKNHQAKFNKNKA